jgi:primase-helicase-like zinc-binding protein
MPGELINDQKSKEVSPERKTPSVAAPGVNSEKSCGSFTATIANHNQRSNITAASLLDLLSDLKHAGTSKRGPEYHSPCPFCGGTDRFISWPEQGNTGRYWCRQCGKRGDAIQLLRDRDGCTFVEAKRRLGLLPDRLSRKAIKRQRARRTALTLVYDAYKSWTRQKLIELTDEYRELLAELEIAETACRQIQRRPDLYTLDDAMWWVGQQYAIREQIAAREHQLDVLTYDKYEVERVRWWKKEVEGESRCAA